MDNLFVELLQVSLGTRDTLSRAPSIAEWGALYVESQRQCVSSLMICGLERLSVEQKPPQTLLFKWIGLNQMTEVAYALQCERAKELTRRFKQQGYRSCVLKGIGTAQLYPVPARRHCGDIDLWVYGDRKKITECLKTQYAIGHSEWHHIEVAFFPDVSVEVHFHPAWLYNPFHNRKLQRFFEQKKEFMMEDKPDGYNYPPPGFDVVFSLVHIYHHFLEEGVGLRHVIDYYYILNALTKEELESSFEIIHSLGIKKFLASMMWVLQYVCGTTTELLICEPDEREGQFFLDEIIRGGNFGKYRKDNRKRNTISRMIALLPHYPSEVLWMLPWKLWHKGWRMFRNMDE